MDRWVKVGVIAGVIAAVVAVIAYLRPPHPSDVEAKPGSGITSTTATSAISSPPTPQADAPASAPNLAKLNVIHVCNCSAPRSQGQIKMQLSITNVSQVTLNADIANVRLLVPGDKLPGPWTPNQPVTQLSNVTVDGQAYVAVPANQNRAWEPQYGTWASHWTAGALAPGETNSGGVSAADLVFYVPADANGRVSLGGVALVTNDGASVLGWQLADQWPAPTEPNTF